MTSNTGGVAPQQNGSSGASSSRSARMLVQSWSQKRCNTVHATQHLVQQGSTVLPDGHEVACVQILNRAVAEPKQLE
eukprot:CAMPEP_0172858680 /NCGR_PEP_ID=MMETSP1075-20121228/67604_1 /TAXON_ID=2916 /ORGANISM="Ceratium fusus, Strain PA161109" /LENGTH=76 /DNA_ID=CAMNT_0013706279 /DNA_START=398 /DNA_END=625 /DNA_ORIENTATION=-